MVSCASPHPSGASTFPHSTPSDPQSSCDGPHPGAYRSSGRLWDPLPLRQIAPTLPERPRTKGLGGWMVLVLYSRSQIASASGSDNTGREHLGRIRLLGGVGTRQSHNRFSVYISSAIGTVTFIRNRHATSCNHLLERLGQQKLRRTLWRAMESRLRWDVEEWLAFSYGECFASTGLAINVLLAMTFHHTRRHRCDRDSKHYF